MLIRGVIHLAYTDPIHVRLVGILFLLLETVLFWKLVRLIFSRYQDICVNYYTCCLLFISSGILPLMSVINRPEQNLLIGILLLLLIVLSNKTQSVIYTILTIVICIWIFSSHPKSLTIFPLIFCCAYFSSRIRLIRFISITAVSVGALDAFMFYNGYADCPQDPNIQMIMSNWVLSPRLLISNPGEFLNKSVENLNGAWIYLYHIFPRVDYVPNWLPSVHSESSKLAINIARAAQGSWIGICIIIFFTSFYRLIKDLFRQRLLLNGDRNRVIGICLLVSLSFCSAFQAKKLFYEAVFIVPLVFIGIILFCHQTVADLWYRVRGSHIRWLLYILLLSPGIVIGSIYFSPLYIATIKAELGQDDAGIFQVPVTYYRVHRSQISDLAVQCGLDPKEQHNHLVVDDSTYFAFPHLFQPYHLLYVYYSWGQGIPDLRSFLIAQGSSGIIANCNLFPKSLVPLSLKSGDTCCYSFAQVSSDNKK